MRELLTLGKIAPEVREFINMGNGACNPKLLAARVSEACANLLTAAELPYTTWKMRMRLNKNEFPLPDNFETILACNFDNAPAHVNNPYVEFMEVGPGEARSWIGTGTKDLIDNGIHPLMYDIPSIMSPMPCSHASPVQTSYGARIVAFSTEQSDAGKFVTIRGRDQYNAEMVNPSADEKFNPNEDVPINWWLGGHEGEIPQGHTTTSTVAMGNKRYRSIGSWEKPETKGYVTLYAYIPETNQWHFLAKAHPDITTPCWRRYKVSGLFSHCGTIPTSVLIYAKMAAYELRRDSDILPVQNLTAVRLMVQAIEKQRGAEVQLAEALKSEAMNTLLMWKADHFSGTTQINIIDQEEYATTGLTYDGWCP